MPPQMMTAPAGHAHAGTRKTGGQLFGLSLATWLLATIVSVIVTVATSFGATAVLASGDTSSSDPWSGLAALALGVFIGLAAGALFYVIAAVLIGRALIPAGQRALPIIGVILGPPAILIALSILGSITPN